MNKETTIFIDTENMEERYAEGLYMDYLKEENKKLQARCDRLTNNRNKLKEWLEEVVDYEEYDKIERDTFQRTLNKMQEIEGGVDNEY